MMRGSKARLINAARRSMIQRAELERKLGIAREAFKPRALVDRGKYRVGEKVDDVAHATRQQFRDNRLPIALAAVAGLAWLFREPIKDHAPRVGRRIKEMAASVADRLTPSHETLEEDDEAVQ